jgi:hypothetical protein
MGYEGDDMRDMAAAVCGEDYYKCAGEDARWHMRRDAAAPIALFTMSMESMELDMSDEEFDEWEGLILYDERIGKIPYSYTDPEVDYDIHGDPIPIRLECDETFIYSLVKARLAAVVEKSAGGEYKILTEIYDLDELLEKAIAPFKALNKTSPPHKKFGD